MNWSQCEGPTSHPTAEKRKRKKRRRADVDVDDGAAWLEEEES